MQKTIVIRVDASIRIGSGHVMRCLTLANELRVGGVRVIFIVRELPGNYADFLFKQDFFVFRLPYNKNYQKIVTGANQYQAWLEEDWEVDAKQVANILKEVGRVDFLIVDHYGLDQQWEVKVKKYVNHIMVMDDLANRSHACDILLDSSLFPDQLCRYNNLIPSTCSTLYGAQYVLLRKEFLACRKLRVTKTNAKRGLIFMGGADAENVTEKVIEACLILNSPELFFEVVVGSANPHQEAIRNICAKLPNFSYHCQINNMAELISTVDFGVGSGGAATWERCSLGLPALMLSVGENEEPFCQNIDALGAQKYIGRAQDLDASSIAKHLKRLITNTDGLDRQRMSKIAFDLVDGLGSSRVAAHLANFEEFR